MNEQVFWIVLGVALGAFILHAVLGRWDKRRRRAINRRAQRGESDAEKLLRREGYHIIENQARRPVRMFVDGEVCESFIKADYMVEKQGKVFLVEVKTGKQANVRLPNVRRQLFEYQHIFHCDGILFIDMNEYDMMKVSFDRENHRTLQLSAFLWGLVIGVLVTVFIFSYQ